MATVISTTKASPWINSTMLADIIESQCSRLYYAYNDDVLEHCQIYVSLKFPIPLSLTYPTARGRHCKMAEDVGIEPTEPCGPTI